MRGGEAPLFASRRSWTTPTSSAIPASRAAHRRDAAKPRKRSRRPLLVLAGALVVLVGLAPVASAEALARADRSHAVGTTWPPPIKPVFPHRLPGEGVWRRTGPLVDGGPAVLVTTFRPQLDSPS